MTPSLLLALAALLPQPGADWTPLFDGESLDGWTQHGGKAAFTVEDGCIVGETRPNTSNSFLCTSRDYDNFVLELDVNVDNELNSGVQVRSHAREGDDVVYGYQVEIDPTNRGFSAGIYEEQGRGWIAQPTPDEVAHCAFVLGDWNHYRVEAEDGRIRTYLNGIPVADLQDDKTASGFIGLQVHAVGGRTDPLRVRWKNLRIRELD